MSRGPRPDVVLRDELLDALAAGDLPIGLEHRRMQAIPARLVAVEPWRPVTPPARRPVPPPAQPTPCCAWHPDANRKSRRLADRVCPCRGECGYPHAAGQPTRAVDHPA